MTLILFHIFKPYLSNIEKKEINIASPITLIAASSFFYILWFVNLFLSAIVNSTRFMSNPLYPNSAIIAIVWYVLLLYLFDSKKYYLKIYEKHKNSERNTKFLTIVSWLILLLGFFILPITKIIATQK
jgi:NADH:ubiquinone oxidoreductase subunit 6 (subunit J)